SFERRDKYKYDTDTDVDVDWRNELRRGLRRYESAATRRQRSSDGVVHAFARAYAGYDVLLAGCRTQRERDDGRTDLVVPDRTPRLIVGGHRHLRERSLERQLARHVDHGFGCDLARRDQAGDAGCGLGVNRRTTRDAG